MKRVILTAVLVLGAQVLTLAQSQHPGYDDIGNLDFRADLNRDGYADFNDVAKLAASWLEQGCGLLKACNRADVFPRCGNGAVNFYDFSGIAEQWRMCTDVGDSNCSHVPLSLKEPPSRLVSFAHPASCENRCASGKLSTVPANPAHGVYLFSGEFHKSVVDFQIPGRGFDFIWARTYRSRTGPNTRIGNGWDYSYNIKIQPCGADLIVYGGDARRDIYYQQLDGTWIAEGFFRVLTQNLDLSFTLTFGGSGAWTFHPLDDSNSAGQITRITDRNGNSMLFDYDVNGRLITIKDTLERNITLSYNGNGLIDGVTDFNDRTVSYQYYDGIEPNGLLGDLKSVTTPAVTGTPTGNDFPSGKTTLYTYSTGFADDRLNHNLLTITDPNGRTFLQNTYSDDVNDPNFDHVVRQVLGNPNYIIDLTYVRQTPDANNNYTVTRTVTNDCVGNVGEHFFDNRNQLAIEHSYTGRADPNAPTYLDPDKNPPVGKLRAGDPDYFETRYQYNNQYLCTRIDYPKDNYVTNVHEVDLDPAASQRSCGNLRERHLFAGALEPISDQNEIIELFEYDTGLGGCGCGGTNFVTRYVDPNGNKTLHEYDPNGNRIRTTYPTLPGEPNIVEEWRYNEFGQVTQNLLPNDGCTPQRWDEFTYYTGLDGDQNGYLKNIVADANNLAVTITFTYDAVGNILTETDPNGDTTSYSVNQLNQIVVETSPAPFNYQIKYFYDDCDNQIRVERPFGGGTALTQYSYDALGQMTRMEQDVGDGNTATTQYEYDGNGNLIRVIDAKGNIALTTYDERDLVYQVTHGYGSPEATTETRHYDKNANFKKLYDGNGNLAFDREYDGFDRLVKITDPCASIKSYTYDPVGNKTSLTDEKGNTTKYEYDPLNRLICITDPCGFTQSYTYDAVANRISATDKNGNTTADYEYDGLNRLISLTDPCDCNESYTYDAVGNRISSTDKNGHTTDYEYDALNRLISLTDPCGFSEGYDYDEAGNRTTLTDKTGNTTTYEYDALNRLISLSDPCGFTQSYTYDDVGNRISSTDKNANTTDYEYDPLNRLISITDPCGFIESQTYNAVGNKTSYTDKNGNTTDYEYDALNRLIKITDPCGFVESYDYDAVGNRISSTDKKENTTTYKYDGLDRLIKVTDPCGFNERYAYDAVGNRISRTDKNAHTTTYTYDGLDRLIRITDPCGFSTTHAYDCGGNKISQTDANGNTTTYQYDPLDRRIKEFDALGYPTTYGYDAVGNVNSVTDANGNVTTYTYDPLNRLITKTDALGCVTTYGYDGVGNRTSVKDANDHTRTYAYDELNRLIKITSPLAYETKYRYDGVGNIVEKTDPNGDTTSYQYDGLERRVLISYADGNTIAYEYDENGNVTKLTNTGGIGDITYKSYDGLNRLASVTTDYGLLFTKTIKYTYDGVGNRITMDADANVTSYEYDALNRPVKVTDPLGNATTYEYDEIGRRTKMTRQNGIKTTFSYDKVGNLLNLTNRKSFGELISSYDYTYDGVGNRLTMTDTYPMSSFTTWYQYDKVYRLVDVDTSWGSTRQYTYDCVGNRLSNVTDGLATGYTYDADNKLLTATGVAPTTYTYDNRGNLKTKTNIGGTTSYQYNYGNKLTNVGLPMGGSVGMQYSAAGNRLSKSASPGAYFNVTCSYCSGCCQWYCDVTMEYDDDGTEVASYTSGPQIDEHISVTMSGMTYYYVTDGLGNVTAIYDQAEAYVASYEYDAFGSFHQYGMPLENPYNFTGREYDNETGLYYNNERYYDPEVGRFTSQDPLENEPENCNGSCDSPAPQPDDEEQHHNPPIQEGTGDNLYAYVGNNPVNRVDPLGLFWSTVRDATYPDGDGVSCTTCASSKVGGCGSAVAVANPPTGHTLCLYKVYGSASCDLSKPVSEPHDKKNNNETCTSKCTDAHEDEHDKNMKDCCDKARQAWQDAATEQIGVYRGRGLGQKTLAKKIRNIDKDRKVRAARRGILNQYNNYVNGARASTECNAYKVSVQCANTLWDDYNCDCPKPEDRKCCRDIERYRKNAERQRDRNCKKKGADKPPDCPF